jgi:hypothetical protein
MQEEIHKELWNRDDRPITQLPERLQIKGQKIPDPKKHQTISFIKSAIRLGACALGFFGLFEAAFIGLFLAELVGIGEELV